MKKIIMTVAFSILAPSVFACALSSDTTRSTSASHPRCGAIAKRPPSTFITKEIISNGELLHETSYNFNSLSINEIPKSTKKENTLSSFLITIGFKNEKMEQCYGTVTADYLSKGEESRSPYLSFNNEKITVNCKR